MRYLLYYVSVNKARAEIVSSIAVAGENCFKQIDDVRVSNIMATISENKGNSLGETKSKLSAIDIPVHMIRLELVEYERKLGKLNRAIDAAIPHKNSRIS